MFGLSQESTVHWVSVRDGLPQQSGRYLCRIVFFQDESTAMYQVIDFTADGDTPHFKYEDVAEMEITHWTNVPEFKKEENHD